MQYEKRILIFVFLKLPDFGITERRRRRTGPVQDLQANFTTG